MFDIGFWELVIVATVALLVVGPDKIPAFAKNTGMWLGKIRRLINNLQRELKQELFLGEETAFKQQLEELDDLMKNAPDRAPGFTSRSAAADKDADLKS